VSWGDYGSGDASEPYFFVVVRGRLAETELNAAQAAHDAVAGSSEDLAKAAGDLAHVVHTGLADPQEFLAIDIWDDLEALGEFYANPEFEAAFATLFEDRPDVSVYASTHWQQW
jgi:quinol monooxygenase YgiN